MERGADSHARQGAVHVELHGAARGVDARAGAGASERSRACETLGAFEAEWRDVRPRSVSLERARELADGLSCSPPSR